MRVALGSAHAGGLYDPVGDGNQFTNGCNAIWDLGLRNIKIYATAAYATDYPDQVAWSGTPTTLTEFASLAEVDYQLGRGWDSVTLTSFPFSTCPSVVTNWWRTGADNARLALEFAEMEEFGEHILTAHSGTGTAFYVQCWEQDWALPDSFSVPTAVSEKNLRDFIAFNRTRQSAIESARRNTAHAGVSLRNILEVNRVLDWRTSPGRRRIVNSALREIAPDEISWSSYDGITPSDDPWKADYTHWKAWLEQYFVEGIKILSDWGGKPIVIGEAGIPENESPYSVTDMVTDIVDLCEAHAEVKRLMYWQVYDNESSADPEGVRGYYLIKPNGDTSEAGAVLAGLVAP